MLAPSLPADRGYVPRLAFGFVQQPPHFGHGNASVALSKVKGESFVAALQGEQHAIGVGGQLNRRCDSSDCSRHSTASQQPVLSTGPSYVTHVSLNGSFPTRVKGPDFAANTVANFEARA